MQTSFVGMGLGLAVALPSYMRRRWPVAFAAPVTDRPVRYVGGVAALAAAVGLVWLYWAVGGAWGIAHAERGDTSWHILTGVGAAWALAGAIGLWMMRRVTRPSPPVWLPVVLVWLGSGSLFSWSGWKLPLMLHAYHSRPDEITFPENIVGASALHVCAVAAGLAMMRVLVRNVGRGSARGLVPHRKDPC
ncbi:MULTISPECIES: hypothetical protein [unclassified Streptomyces]|uniref:hypothetical protein n=1 Tax=unclassified Streptomyces TaxID=2593676 RepID=UPI000F749BAC|nr:MULTISPECIES: hypothetical protein [unclassified Streptomyces]